MGHGPPDFLGPSDYFEGVIRALGLDIPEGTDDTPPKESRIRWVNEITGEVGEEIFGTDSAGIRSLNFQIDEDLPTIHGAMYFTVGSMLFRIFSDSSGTKVDVGGVDTPGTFNKRLIIDYPGGGSNFVSSRYEKGGNDNPGTAGLQIIRGTFNGGGTVGAIIEGAGFSWTRPFAGVYVLTWDDPFNNPPVCIATADTRGGGAAVAVDQQNPSVTGAQFQTGGVNKFINFIAIGN